MGEFGQMVGDERRHFENLLYLRAMIHGWTDDPLCQPATSVLAAYRQMRTEREASCAAETDRLYYSQEVSIDNTRARQGRAFHSIFFGLFLPKGVDSMTRWKLCPPTSMSQAWHCFRSQVQDWRS
jgi:hypothetical protein